ncbi:MAG: hypothetical protein A4E67_00597 [Syntrophaceae bacterium PtaB.Bin038]|nr:MAG: hypothetical protein A4E67_00597 [Syntrophaceae bacterium PtaB.Bin038]
MQILPPADNLLRTAVHILIGSGPGPSDPGIAECLREIFPDTCWRLALHEAVTAHAAVSLVRSVPVHLAILLLDRVDCTPPDARAFAPASPLGLLRILRSAWNVPVVAVAGRLVEAGREKDVLDSGADCVLRHARGLRSIRYRIEAMTSVFYSRNRLEIAADVPAYVKNQLRRWDSVAAVAFESFRRYGRVVMGIEADAADPGGAKFTAISANPFGGWPDRVTRQMALSYDPECEVLVRFTDLGGRVRTERLRTGPEGNTPRKAHKIGLLNDTLRAVRVERRMAPVG